MPTSKLTEKKIEALESLRDILMGHRPVLEAALLNRSGLTPGPGELTTPIKEILAALAECE
jgi:hypothetical protein